MQLALPHTNISTACFCLNNQANAVLKDIYRRINAIKWLYPITTRHVLIIKGNGIIMIFKNIDKSSHFFDVLFI